MPLKILKKASHLAYTVKDIDRAAHYWSKMMGAGPFFMIEHIPFDEVTHKGRACVFDHSAAFGQWGTIAVELQQIHESSPQSLTDKLIPGPMPVINHLAYISTTPEEDSEELTKAGHELFLHAKFGPIEVRFHDTSAVLGQAIEIHRHSAELDEMFARIADEARGWNGERYLRKWGF